MLTSSLRRAVRLTSSTPSSAIAIPIPCAANVSNNTARRQYHQPQHQRRYSSSSKPPVPPNDGSRPIDASSQQTPTGPSTQRKMKDGSNTKSRKTSSTDAGTAASKSRQNPALSLNLPSVPSTQHTPLEDIRLASFFSVHRPISVSTSVPPTSNEAAFNAIFENKSSSSRRGTRATDVINTLTSAVVSMENAMTGQGHDQFRNAITQASVSNAEPGARLVHLDEVSEEELHSSIAEFANRLAPFQPPAPPQPYDAAEEAAEQESMSLATEEGETDVRTYSTVLTVRETAYANGQRTIETSFSPFPSNQDRTNPSISISIDEPSPSPADGNSYIERTLNRKMYTISVRRQRKLKMKKHKFKKLLRKTRTLRRKLDKA